MEIDGESVYKLKCMELSDRISAKSFPKNRKGGS